MSDHDPCPIHGTHEVRFCVDEPEVMVAYLMAERDQLRAEIERLKHEFGPRLLAAEDVAHEAHVFLTDFLNLRKVVPGALQRKIDIWRNVNE